jgi:hypothetical protein
MRIRRNKDEIRKVIEDLRTSGLTRAEYSRRSGIPLGTLANYCRRKQVSGLVRVSVGDGWQTQQPRLALVLPGGRRIEIGANFDDTELLRLIRVVEAA